MFWTKKKKPKKGSREAIVAQAEAVATAKRAEIGDDALNKIKQALMKKENSPLERAKRHIKGADEGKVRDNLALWLKDDE